MPEPGRTWRFRQWQITQVTHWGNMHFQYQQHFLHLNPDSARTFVAWLLGIYLATIVVGAAIGRMLMSESDSMHPLVSPMKQRMLEPCCAPIPVACSCMLGIHTT